MWMVRALLLLAYTKQTLPLIGCSWNATALIEKACREFSNKINRITAAIGVILAFTGKKMFYFNKKSEVPQNSKKQLRPLLMPRSFNFRQHYRNLSRKTVPLSSGWANLDQASKDLDKTIFRDLSPTPIPWVTNKSGCLPSTCSLPPPPLPLDRGKWRNHLDFKGAAFPSPPPSWTVKQ